MRAPVGVLGLGWVGGQDCSCESGATLGSQMSPKPEIPVPGTESQQQRLSIGSLHVPVAAVLRPLACLSSSFEILQTIKASIIRRRVSGDIILYL